MKTHELANQLLAKADVEISDALAKRLLEPKKAGHTGTCWCGCGAETKSRFVPGHDSKFHGLAKRVARGEEAMPESFVCPEAEADFMKWHDEALTKHEADEAEKAAAKARKEAAKVAA